jgi:ABC-type molybdate transport system substrate-binding protein
VPGRARTLLPVLAAALGVAGPAVAGDPVRLHAAGSLKQAMSDVVEAFTERTGTAVQPTFAPSGLLRQRIEEGERTDVFASANMAHPQRLAEQGNGGPVVLFTRNRLCALAQEDVALTPDNMLDVLLRDDIRVGTSTPEADPSGDYAWAMFERAGAIRDGATARLKDRSLQLTGGPDSPAPPQGRHKYAWVMDSDQADVFLTYCTNAVAARREVNALQVVQLPGGLAVGADYGLSILSADNPRAVRLATFILSPAGQSILAEYGFDTPLMPAGG